MSASADSTGRTTVDPAPACISCRQRKLRCSRELPACEQCVRLSKECVYDHRRQKPGLKAGTIDSIHRRLDELERRVSEHERSSQYAHPTVKRVSSFNTDNDHTLSNSAPTAQSHDGRPDGRSDEMAKHSPIPLPAPKRRRFSSESPRTEMLRSQSLMDAAVTQYFRTTHHWVPMVHEGRFREQLRNTSDLKPYDVLLRAMLASSLRHIVPAQIGMSMEQVREEIELATTEVIMQGITQTSMQSAQALIIITFEKLGQGEWTAALSLLGTLTRMIDCLGLTTDEGPTTQQQLLRPLQLLDSPSDHAESEERRRVFWNVLLLDRFCSVSCGLPTALTADKVRRRLPCNGALWRNRQPSTTPYFGVWDKSQAKLGHPVAYLPAHRVSSNDDDETSSPVTADGLQRIDVSHLGAVAYRIEATESLSQISSFFLRQAVDLRNPNEMRDWLTRFTELDLRLVQWKMFLPQQWRDSNVSRGGSVHMDPNLTLAHVIHNTSTVLLHQQIAYPPIALKQAVNLPSPSSAKTCQLAAVEITSITARYVAFAKITSMFVNSEFVFCAFVAGVALLAHSQYLGTEVGPHYESLIDSLDEMSARWNGHDTSFATEKSDYSAADDLAALAVYRLHQLRARLHENPNSFADILLQSTLETLMYPSASSNSNPQSTPVDIRQNQGSYAYNTAANGQIPLSLVSPDGQQHGSQYGTPNMTELGNMRNTSHQNQPQLSTENSLSLGNPVPQASSPSMYSHTLANGPYMNGSPYIPDYSILPNLVVRDDLANLDRVITSDGTNFDFDSFLPNARPPY